LWLTTHDINWWVAVATIAYIGLQAYYLIQEQGGIAQAFDLNRKRFFKLRSFAEVAFQ
jgi:hypothetical protein